MIRIARPEEVPTLARMLCQAHPWTYFRYREDECLDRLSNAQCTLYVVECDGAVIAFAQVTPRGSFGGVWIELICVAEAARGQGVGSGLIAYIVDTLFPRENIYLTVSAVNPRAKALYDRLGFDQVGEIPDYNFPGVSEHLMRLSRGPKRAHVLEE